MCNKLTFDFISNSDLCTWSTEAKLFDTLNEFLSDQLILLIFYHKNCRSSNSCNKKTKEHRACKPSLIMTIYIQLKNDYVTLYIYFLPTRLILWQMSYSNRGQLISAINNSHGGCNAIIVFMCLFAATAGYCAVNWHWKPIPGRRNRAKTAADVCLLFIFQ